MQNAAAAGGMIKRVPGTYRGENESVQQRRSARQSICYNVLIPMFGAGYECRVVHAAADSPQEQA